MYGLFFYGKLKNQKEKFNMSDKNNKQLCPNCKTGKDMYLLDNRSPFCPYISCHNGEWCAKFRPLKENSENYESR